MSALTETPAAARPWSVPLADVVVADDDIEAVVATYRSGWLSMGPETERLEHAFAGYSGCRHALAVANGTAALHLICMATGLGPGDEVIVPSMTFVATVNAVRYTGATPVFADIASLTEPWLDPAAEQAALSPRTKAILTVSYGGHPGATDALRALAESCGLTLLEDAAHSVGARAGTRHLGTLGTAGAFSFFSNKNLAVGEGGMAVTDDDEVAERMRLLRSHGMTTLTWDRHRGHAAGYDVTALGFNYRIDEPRATLAHRRLLRLDAENDQRRSIDARYRAVLRDLDGATPALEPAAGAQNAHHLFTLVLAEGVDRQAFRAALAQRGVQTSVHYPPVHRFSIYRDAAADLPLTDAYGERTVTLPLFPHMTAAQQETVTSAVAAALQEQA